MIKVLEDLHDVLGTTFQGDTILTTTDSLIKLFGEPIRNPYPEKITREWNLVYNGIPFTIYDWKEYREYSDNERIYFHIGAREMEESKIVLKELLKELSNHE